LNESGATSTDAIAPDRISEDAAGA
jgi:hypothetical protein